MTYGKFCIICTEKIFGKHSQELESLVASLDEQSENIFQICFLVTDYTKLVIMGEIEEIYELLRDELGVKKMDVNYLHHNILSKDFVLPPKTAKRAKRLQLLNFSGSQIVN